MIDILSFLPTKKKLTPAGWWSFNAVCCHHNGEKPDKRGRGGIKIATDGSFTYSCFNCHYTATFTIGKPLSFKVKRLLSWMGVDTQIIEHFNLESLKHKSIYGLIQQPKIINKTIDFPERELPPEFSILDEQCSSHAKFFDYLVDRGIDPESYPFMVSPESTGRNSNRVIVPFTHHGKIIGHTSRFLDSRIPKYIHEMPHGYVFGLDLQKPHWNKLFVVEGVFDALAINGVATLHNTISDEQAALINQLNKEVIVVPDHDKAGLKLIDRAIELHWSVSIPQWGETIKDASDAVRHYGKLATIMSIVESSESNRLKIKLRQKSL